MAFTIDPSDPRVVEAAAAILGPLDAAVVSGDVEKSRVLMAGALLAVAVYMSNLGSNEAALATLSKLGELALGLRGTRADITAVKYGAEGMYAAPVAEG